MEKKFIALGVGLGMSLALNTYAIVQLSMQDDDQSELAIWTANRLDETSNRIDDVESELKELHPRSADESPMSRLLAEQALDSRITSIERQAEISDSKVRELEDKFSNLCIQSGGRACL